MRLVQFAKRSLSGNTSDNYRYPKEKNTMLLRKCTIHVWRAKKPSETKSQIHRGLGLVRGGCQRYILFRTHWMIYRVLHECWTVTGNLSSVARKPDSKPITGAISCYSSWDSTISIGQAYLSLMKSNWILEEVVLRKEEYEDLPEKENIKMILEISKVGRHFPVRLLPLWLLVIASVANLRAT